MSDTKLPIPRRTVAARDARESGKLAERAPAFSNGKIALHFANELERNHGSWIWDGLLYEQDGIIDPMLQILPNHDGSKIRRILRECYNLRDV